MLCDGFDLAVLILSDRKRHDTHVSLLLRVTVWVLFIREFISPKSCHLSYCITPFFHELNTLDACWVAVMCGVIVVDAGRSRSTNLGRDAYIMIIAWISS